MIWVNEISDDQPSAQHAFSSLDNAFAIQGERITKSPVCSVDRVVLDDEAFYIKHYHRAGKGLSEFVAASKARCEWQNLLRFLEWGLPVAELVAYGEESRSFSGRRGAVVTREVKGSTDLAKLAKTNPEKFRNLHWFSAISEQVAEATRVMHQHNFAHNDWKWRNILVVETDSGPKIHMIDCPSGSVWWGPFFEYRRIKDLACLDKVGRYALSRTQRLRFYFNYVQRTKLNNKDKKVIRKVLAFFEGRE